MNVVLVGSKIVGPFYHTYEKNKQWAQVMCKRTLSIIWKEIARLKMCMKPILVSKCFLGWDMQIIHKCEGFR
jgi:hypothetical protein